MCLNAVTPFVLELPCVHFNSCIPLYRCAMTDLASSPAVPVSIPVAFGFGQCSAMSSLVLCRLLRKCNPRAGSAPSSCGTARVVLICNLGQGKQAPVLTAAPVQEANQWSLRAFGLQTVLMPDFSCCLCGRQETPCSIVPSSSTSASKSP